jgi:hypothetical protein
LGSAVGFLRLIYIPTHLIVHGKAAETASNIVAHDLLFRWGIVSYLLCGVLVIFYTLALYRLLKEVDQSLAVLMVILGCLMQTPIFFFNTANDVAALLFARGADFLSVFDKPQRDAFALLFLNLHYRLDIANMMFAGLWLLPFGLLVYRSRLLPRFLGVWLMMACFAYLALSFSGLLFSGNEDKVFAMGQPFMWGEVVTMLWLAIMGAKDQRLAAITS